MKNALYSLFGVIAGFILAGTLFFVSRAPSGPAIVLQPAPTKAPIAIQVNGAVVRPGLYYLPEGARVQDAIDVSGGLLATSNVKNLNLAAKVEDSQQLDIPFKDGEGPVDDSALELPNEVAVATEAPAELGSPAFSGELIDVNVASLEELDTLPGIGPSTAQKIIDYRDENGPFYAVEDLLNVSGIGEATLENIRDLITTGY